MVERRVYNVALIEEFKTKEAAALVGMPDRTILYWGKIGFIVPSIQPAGGRGRPAKWSFRDVIQLRVARELRESGVSFQGLRRVKEALDGLNLEAPFAEAWLVTDTEGEVYLRRDDEVLESLTRQPAGQLAWARVILHLPSIKKDLERKLREVA